MPPITPDGRSDARPSSWLLFPQSLGTAVLSPIAEGCFHPRRDAGGFNAALPVETRQSCFANGLTLCCLGNCLSPFHPTCWRGALVGARQGVWGCGGAGVQPPRPCSAPRCCFPSLQDFTPIGALQVPRNCSTASKRGCFLGKKKKPKKKKKKSQTQRFPNPGSLRAVFVAQGGTAGGGSRVSDPATTFGRDLESPPAPVSVPASPPQLPPQAAGVSWLSSASRDGVICCTFAGMSVSFKAELL